MPAGDQRSSCPASTARTSSNSVFGAAMSRKRRYSCSDRRDSRRCSPGQAQQGLQMRGKGDLARAPGVDIQVAQAGRVAAQDQLVAVAQGQREQAIQARQEVERPAAPRGQQQLRQGRVGRQIQLAAQVARVVDLAVPGQAEAARIDPGGGVVGTPGRTPGSARSSEPSGGAGRTAASRRARVSWSGGTGADRRSRSQASRGSAVAVARPAPSRSIGIASRRAEASPRRMEVLRRRHRLGRHAGT